MHTGKGTVTDPEVRKTDAVVTTKQSVLLVDDESIVRESLGDWLENAGYQIATAETGEQALDMLGKECFGVVVLDLKLPARNGLEVLQEARAQRPWLKTILITAYPSVETTVEAMKVGAVDYLTKPFEPDALEKLIQEALESVPVG